MELIKPGSTYDFLGKRRWCFLFSAILVATTAYLWVTTGDNKYGIDFTGGNEILVRIEGATSTDAVRVALEKGGVDSPHVQAFEAGTNEYSIRLGGSDANAAREQVSSAIKAGFGEKFEVLQTDFVGPTIGSELKRKALIAAILGLLGISVYVAVRFEVAFAMGALVALAHDLIIAVGVYLFVGHDLTMASLAAALTIVGYSVNDTIVIFDRLREEMRKRSSYDLESLMNEVMNAMLGRTLITSGLTLLSTLALLIFGGGAIADLSVFLVAGIISGSYSTIYIASPVVLWWEGWQRSRRGSSQLARSA
jgi:preprotein translocase subunit SecF